MPEPARVGGITTVKTRNFYFMLAVAIASAALFYFGREHWGHIFGVLPYLLFLSCPLMHLFMHHGHGGHSRSNEPRRLAHAAGPSRHYTA